MITPFARRFRLPFRGNRSLNGWVENYQVDGIMLRRMAAKPCTLVKTAKFGGRGCFNYMFADLNDAVRRLFRLEQLFGSFFRGSADRVDCVALNFLTQLGGLGRGS